MGEWVGRWDTYHDVVDREGFHHVADELGVRVGLPDFGVEELAHGAFWVGG